MAKCGTANHYPAGQCTVYADQRYHDLTGCYVPWSGNAWQWEGLARTAGWNVSSTPHVPSIMCLQGGVQGASPLGHVGVVESINGDGSFISSNLNWQPHPTQVLDIKHTPGKGVSFLSSSGTSFQGGIMAGTLTYDQAAQLAYNAGFRGNGLITIVAIAAAESGLRTDAQNLADCCGGSWGIVQINGAHFHAGGTTKSCALNPACAFKYAFTLSGGHNFQPWGSFTNGSYAQHLSAATTAASHITGVKTILSMSTGSIPSTSDTSTGTKDTGSAGNIFNFLPGWTDNPVRILKLVAGVMLIGLAIVMLITPEGQIVGQAVGRPVTSGLKTVRSSVKALTK
jgi:surface antigen